MMMMIEPRLPLLVTALRPALISSGEDKGARGAKPPSATDSPHPKRCYNFHAMAVINRPSYNYFPHFLLYFCL